MVKTFVFAKMTLGKESVQAGDFVGCASELEAAIEVVPSRGDQLLYLAAECWERAGKTASAQRAFLRVAADFPDSSLAAGAKKRLSPGTVLPQRKPVKKRDPPDAAQRAPSNSPRMRTKEEILAGFNVVVPETSACATQHALDVRRVAKVKMRIDESGSVIEADAQMADEYRDLGVCVEAAVRKASFGPGPTMSLTYPFLLRPPSRFIRQPWPLTVSSRHAFPSSCEEKRARPSHSSNSRPRLNATSTRPSATKNSRSLQYL